MRTPVCAPPPGCGLVGNDACWYGVVVIGLGAAHPQGQTLRPGEPVSVMQLRVDASGMEAILEAIHLETWGPWADDYALIYRLYEDADADGNIDAGSTPLAEVPGDATQATVRFDGFGVVMAPASTAHFLVVMEATRVGAATPIAPFARPLLAGLLGLLVLLRLAPSRRPRWAVAMLLLALVTAAPTACTFALGQFAPVVQVTVADNADVVLRPGPTARGSNNEPVPSYAEGAPLASELIRIEQTPR